MICQTCPWFTILGSGTEGSGEGECRAEPPKAVPISVPTKEGVRQGVFAFWPTVRRGHYCAQHPERQEAAQRERLARLAAQESGAAPIPTAPVRLEAVKDAPAEPAVEASAPQAEPAPAT